MNTLSVAVQVLRKPEDLLHKEYTADELGRLIPQLLLVTTLAAACFGVAVGTFRGGIQIPYAAVKMPLLMLIPVAVTLPATHAFLVAARVESSYSRLVLAGLVGAARTAVLAAGMAPALWLPFSMGTDYHMSVIIFCGVLGIAAIPGLGLVASALPTAGESRGLAIVCGLVTFGMVSAQTGWMLRPFVVRPTVEVAFLRPSEADVGSALMQTGASAMGHYEEWHAAPAGLIGEAQRRAP